MRTIAILIAAIALPAPSFAQNVRDVTYTENVKIAQTAVPLSEGEVRKINKETQKITIRHGPLLNLDMPGMTMVFRVADPMMLDQVQAGDKIRFLADRINGALTITRIESGN